MPRIKKPTRGELARISGLTDAQKLAILRIGAGQVVTDSDVPFARERSTGNMRCFWKYYNDKTEKLVALRFTTFKALERTGLITFVQKEDVSIGNNATAIRRRRLRRRRDINQRFARLTGAGWRVFDVLARIHHQSVVDYRKAIAAAKKEIGKQGKVYGGDATLVRRVRVVVLEQIWTNCLPEVEANSEREAKAKLKAIATEMLKPGAKDSDNDELYWRTDRNPDVGDTAKAWKEGGVGKRKLRKMMQESEADIELLDGAVNIESVWTEKDNTGYDAERRAEKQLEDEGVRKPFDIKGVKEYVIDKKLPASYTQASWSQISKAERETAIEEFGGRLLTEVLDDDSGDDSDDGDDVADLQRFAFMGE